MKFTKKNMDDFKENEISKEKSRKITGGNNFEDDNKNSLLLLTLDPLLTIDPPAGTRPPGQS